MTDTLRSMNLMLRILNVMYAAIFPVAIGILSIAYWEAYWTFPMMLVSVLALAVGITAILKQDQALVCVSIALLSIGAGVAACLHPEEQLANGLLISSLVLTGLMIVSSMRACQLQTNQYESGMGSISMDSILESLQMSENAKRVLFRDRELNLLRRTVQEDISRGEFHSALVLCGQMANVFGAVEEAEELRIRVQEIIHEHHEQRIKDEIAELQTLLDAHKWVEAYQGASRLRRLFPESPLLHGIEQHIADVRTEYRHGLEGRFLEAAKQENVERAMALLRELDGYLTPDEARKFRDTATTVITTYRESLSARFKMAVGDHRWQEAMEFGMEITKQFPNTRMAEEVQTMLETIRVRADEDETAS